VSDRIYTAMAERWDIYGDVREMEFIQRWLGEVQYIQRWLRDFICTKMGGKRDIVSDVGETCHKERCV